MPDIIYEIKTANIFRGSDSVAARAAVLSPLVWRRGMSVVAAYQTLQRQWRQRLIFLKKAGWEPVQDAKAFQYIRNCSLFSVPAIGRACNRSRICPNCYARNIVIDSYNSINLAMRMIDDQSGVKFIAVRERVENLKISDRPWRSNGPVDWVKPVGVVRFIERLKADGDDVYGYKVNITAEPQKEPGLMTITRSGFFIVSKETQLNTELIVNDVNVCNSIVYESLTPAELAAAVGKCFRYPVGMFRGDAETAVEIFKQLHGVTLFKGGGLCSNETYRKILKKIKRNAALNSEGQASDDNE